MPGDEPVIYSVRVREGLDTRHYDVVFRRDGIVLRYLGEYWERSRPITGLQRAMDLHIYRVRKRRARQGSTEETLIPYSDVEGYELRRPQKRRKRRRVGGRTIVEEETVQPRLLLRLRGGRVLELEFAPKVYEIVKSLVKEYLKPALEERGRRGR